MNVPAFLLIYSVAGQWNDYKEKFENGILKKKFENMFFFLKPDPSECISNNRLSVICYEKSPTLDREDQSG